MTDNNPINVCAEDIMQRELITIRASDTLADAERALTDAGVSGAPVVDDTGKMIGVISLRDLAQREVEDRELPTDTDVRVFDNEFDDNEEVSFQRPPSGACAADMMTQDVISVPPSMPAPLVARRMLDHRIHRVMVVDRGRLLGLVSATELLGVMAAMA